MTVTDKHAQAKRLALRNHQRNSRFDALLFVLFSCTAFALHWFNAPVSLVVFAALAALILISSALWNGLTAKQIERGAIEVAPETATRHLIEHLEDGFYRMEYEDDHGDYYIEKILSTSTGDIIMRLCEPESRFLASKPFAIQMERSIETVLANLREYLAEQANSRRFSHYRDEILDLTLASISFWDPKNPGYAEFEFQQNAALRIWSCGYDGGKFEKLGFDD